MPFLVVQTVSDFTQDSLHEGWLEGKEITMDPWELGLVDIAEGQKRDEAFHGDAL